MKLKVGADLEDDIRRVAIAREVIGPDRKLMIDANQKWGVDQAIDWLYHETHDIWWIEEPIADDILGRCYS